MTKDELKTLIVSTSLLAGSFVLRSGRTADRYFDKYQFESSPAILKAIAQHLAIICRGIEPFDYLCGLELGGCPLAAALALQIDRQVTFARKAAKQYGTAKQIEGPDVSGKRILLVEDIVTSGGAVLQAAAAIRAAGGRVETCLAVIDRQAGGLEALKADGVVLASLFKMDELLENSD